MNIIIYAAGISRRLGGHVPDRLKGLVDLNGSSIIDFQLRWAIKFQPQNIVIVLGLEHEKYKDYLGNSCSGIPVEYVYNRDYLEKGNMLSLWAAREYCDNDVLFTTSDLLCDPENIVDFKRSSSPNKILIDNSNLFLTDDDPVKVSIEDGCIKRCIKKLDNNLYRGVAIGIYKFERKAIASILKYIEQCVLSGDDNKSLYFAIDNILNDFKVIPILCKTSNWIDIDTPEELSNAKSLAREIDSNKSHFYRELEEE